MRIMVVWGSRLGGTEGIARIIGEELKSRGFDVTLKSARGLRDVDGYDAAIIGGAVYANLWHRDAHRFVTRNIAALRRIPVWLFSSGPLDDSADHADIPPPSQVAVLADRIGAQGHVTFGGRLPADAKGFPAEAMAKTLSGDWRNADRIRAWAGELAAALPNARPNAAVALPARSIWRLLAHGVAGWAVCAALMAALLPSLGTNLAVIIHAVAAPIIFAAIAFHYFGARGARDPLPTALVFTALVAILDAVVVAALVARSFEMFTSFPGTWLPFILIFGAIWITGTVMSMIPTPKAPQRQPSAGRAEASR